MKLQSNKSRFAKAAATAAVFAAGVLLSGCAILTPKTPEQQVEQRAGEYWKARIEARTQDAYQLLTPGYRASHTLEQYKVQAGVGTSIHSFAVEDVTCEPEKCAVKLKVFAKPALPLSGLGGTLMVTYLDDTWLLVDGRWWRFEAN